MSRLNSPSSENRTPIHEIANMLGSQHLGEGGNENQENSPANNGQCGGGAGYHTPVDEPLVLLMQVTSPGGGALDPVTFTGPAVAEHILRCTGQHAADIEVVTDREAVIELEPGVRVGAVAQRLHGHTVWGEPAAELSCLLSTRRSVLNVVREREIGRRRLQDLELEQQKVREEQGRHQEQMATVLKQFQEEVAKVEKLQKANTRRKSEPKREEPKSIKPPQLPPYSGVDPTPKDEATCDQWSWQVKEAVKTHTEGAVRTAIIQSVRGEVRDFVTSIGFESGVEDMLERIEERFGDRCSVGILKKDFFDMFQRKNEKVRQFAGRLEAQLKRLKERGVKTVDETDLKEKFFLGMASNLHDSVRFCYKREGSTYAELLDEALDAEKEKNDENKGTTARVKVAAMETGEASGIHDLKRKIEDLTATIKSSTYQGAKPKRPNDRNSNNNAKTQGQPKNKPPSPYKGKGPAATAAGPFRPGQRPLQCYQCGGWGHTWRQCATPGGLDWRSLGAENPPQEPQVPKDPTQKQ